MLADDGVQVYNNHLTDCGIGKLAIAGSHWGVGNPGELGWNCATAFKTGWEWGPEG